MKKISPPGYYHNGFIATHPLGYTIYGYALLVGMNERVLKNSKQDI